MKRITVEQSNNLVPYSDDLLNGEISYFTLTPDPADPKWEIVTYYTARKENIYENRGGDGDSWVYVLSNPTMPGLLKIGYTAKKPDERAKQLSRGTGVALPFKVEYAYRCFNAERLEGELHKHFKPYRTNNQKEFFQIGLEEVEISIKKLGKRYL
jgi:hypothetical protein|tara:strand:- start:1343 stop:1807 length:465 start_codon:yes stop_codon:yes gene_type:complete